MVFVYIGMYITPYDTRWDFRIPWVYIAIVDWYPSDPRGMSLAYYTEFVEVD